MTTARQPNTIDPEQDWLQCDLPASGATGIFGANIIYTISAPTAEMATGRWGEEAE